MRPARITEARSLLAPIERTPTRKRRELLQGAAAFGVLAAMPFSAAGKLLAGARAAAAPGSGADAKGKHPQALPNPLTPPAQGSIPVAFRVADGAVVIDFCGPWEVFQDAIVPGRQENPFRLYTVAETTRPIRASAGLTIVPDYTLESAPAPKVIVIPAQHGHSEAMLQWIRRASKGADLTMSVCTGAMLLARTGLLAGKSATTHHDSFRTFAMEFPDVRLRRGAPFVGGGHPPSPGRPPPRLGLSRPSRWSSRTSGCGGAPASSRTATSPPRAASPPAWISRSASSSPITAATPP